MIDRIQDHHDSASVRATYHHHGYSAEMRRALEVLGDRIEAIGTGKAGPSNLVRIA